MLSLGDKISMISTIGGGRYFFAANVVWVLVFLARARKNVAYAILTGFLIAAALASTPKNFDGPDWRNALAQSEAGTIAGVAVRSVDIWPAGWTANIPVSCLGGFDDFEILGASPANPPPGTSG